MTHKLPPVHTRRLLRIKGADLPERTADEDKVYEYISNHPNRTFEDVVLAFKHLDYEFVSQMIQFLIAYKWGNRNDVTHALTVNELYANEGF